MFLERRQHTRLALADAVEDEMEPHQRLAAARGADAECRAAGPVAVGEHLVEGGDPGRASGTIERVAGDVDRVGEPREDVDPICREPVGMPARGELASPQLEDAKGARLALGRSRRGEADDRVRDREFRRDADLILAVLAYP